MGLAPRRYLCNQRMSLRRRRRQRLVRIKVQKLKSIVPGGHGLQLDSLFVHTASYILRLKLQIYISLFSLKSNYDLMGFAPLWLRSGGF
ncbi:transcription factor par2 [Quercus suber]|uniref:Transcription factor par2 n=1 Tax=Quercus suber TaxID=58331 RepID=A0AAW0M252_QUESU